MLLQVAGTLFGFISLWLFYRVFSHEEKVARSARMYFISLIFFTVSLLFKETSISFVVALTLVAVIAWKDYWRGKLLNALRYIYPFYGFAIIYMVIHFTIVPRQVAYRYQLVLSPNMLTNLMLSIFSALFPVLPVTTFVAYVQHHYYPYC